MARNPTPEERAEFRKWSDDHPAFEVRVDGDYEELRAILMASSTKRWQITTHHPLAYTEES